MCCVALFVDVLCCVSSVCILYCVVACCDVLVCGVARVWLLWLGWFVWLMMCRGVVLGGVCFFFVLCVLLHGIAYRCGMLLLCDVIWCCVFRLCYVSIIC